MSTRRPEPARLQSENSIELSEILQSLPDTTQHSTSGQEASEQQVSNHEADYFDSKEGWVVVAASSAVFFVFLGIMYSYGIVQLHLAVSNLAAVSTLSFIGSFSVALTPAMAILASWLTRSYGFRKTILGGSFLCGLGEFTAGWSTKSLAGMFLTQGFLFGAGAGLCFLPTATIASMWFKRKRGLATGTVYAGGGVGAAVFSVALDKLIARVGLASTLRILGVMAWAVCIPASLFIKAPAARAQTSAQAFQWHLLKNYKFWGLLIGGAIGLFPLYVPPFLLPLYVHSIGLSNGTGAAIVAVWNLSSAIGRIGMGLGADTLFGPLNSFIITLLLNGISNLVLWPFSTSVAPLLLFSIINGVGAGGFFSLIPVIAGSMFGSELVANALSLLMTGWTFSYFMGSPIAGYLLGAFGGQEKGLVAFRPAIYYAGSLMLASAGIAAAIRLSLNKKIFTRV